MAVLQSVPDAGQLGRYGQGNVPGPVIGELAGAFAVAETFLHGVAVHNNASSSYPFSTIQISRLLLYARVGITARL